MEQSKFSKPILISVLVALTFTCFPQQKPTGLHINYSFSSDGKEVIIREPNLPEPWLNRLTNDVFHTWITQNGYIESFLLDPNLNGLVNPQDVSGHLYLRNREDGKFLLLNNKGSNSKSWKSVHGLGYTRIETSGLGMDCTVTYFVPRNDNVLVIRIKLHNSSDKNKTFDLFSQVEWSLGDIVKSIVYKGDGRGGSQFNLYKKVTFEEEMLIARQLVWKTLGPSGKPWPYIGFMASSLPVKGFETGKERFLGIPGDFNNPAQVVEGKCTNTNFWSENEYPWGVLQNSIDLKAGLDTEVVIILGMARDVQNIRQLKNKYSIIANVQDEFNQVNEFQKEFINKALKVSTPEKGIDRIINIWSPYQWRSTMSKDLNSGKRGLSFWNYAIEDGNFGFWGGDAELAVQPHDLNITKESIRRNLSMQFYDPKTTHLTATAPAMLYADVDYKLPKETPLNGFKVSHHHEVYGLYSISLYLRETGDFDFLKEQIPFVLGEPGTVFDHMVKGVDYALNGISPRGLPYVNKGVGDWNDEINRMSSEGKAESIMYGMQLCYLLKEYSDIASLTGHQDKAKEWMAKYKIIKDACNQYAWDGNWYVYAFADGEKEPVPIGAAKNKEGTIYLNSQSWSVIGGVADKERADKSLEAVRSRLLSEFGPLLFMPSYTHSDKHVGVQSEYAPGWRNGCMYPRPAGWAIMAACLDNKPDLAWAMYKPASLPYISDNIDRYRAEPYVYAENYVGPDHPKAGLGQFKWNLGEGANWMWHSYVYYILGIRPEFSGLLIDPKIPSDWPGFTMERDFRGDHYIIEVTNPQKVGQGVKSIMLDGKPMKGNTITPVGDGKKHLIKVIMGIKK
jgi:Cellobiose phosphorylase